MKFNGKNVTISQHARIGRNVRIGDNTVIYANVTIGDGSVICNDCVIGEPSKAYYSDAGYNNPPTLIGDGALVRSHAIIYAGVRVGKHLETGHRIHIRENSLIGNNCRIGTMCDLQGNLQMGDHCHLHSSVHLCQDSRLGNFVFMYPFSVLLNDRYPPSEKIEGPKIDDHAQIGAQVMVMAGVHVGKHCLVAAGSLVTHNTGDFSFVMGSPAKLISDVRELRSDNGEILYPWKNRFSRGMPWSNTDSERT